MLALWAAAWASDVDAVFAEARRAEADQRYAEAVALCHEVVDAAPDGGRAPTCARRIAFLERRRDADGAFAGWTTLERVRATWRGAAERAALLAQVAAVADDPGVAAVVRAEAAGWLAQQALDAGDAARAVAVTDGIVARGGLGDDPAVERQVRTVRALALATLGRDAEAVATEAPIRVPVDDAAHRPTPVEQLVAERRRRWAAWAAGAVLAGFGVAAAAAVARAPRVRTPWPAGLAVVLLGVGGAGALAAGWDAAAGAPVPWLAAGLGGVHVVALLALIRLEGRARAAMRVGAALATLAAGWLALWWTGSTAWVGL
ncbi:MAG: hypothetical protein R3F59_37435 [Myxococcota bacterium]